MDPGGWFTAWYEGNKDERSGFMAMSRNSVDFRAWFFGVGVVFFVGGVVGLTWAIDVPLRTARVTRLASDDGVSNASAVAITHVVLYPDDWNAFDEATKSAYTASAVGQGIKLRIVYPATTNRNQVMTVSDGDFTVLDAPYYFGPTQCGRPAWEHKLRELLALDDPRFH